MVPIVTKNDITSFLAIFLFTLYMLIPKITDIMHVDTYIAVYAPTMPPTVCPKAYIKYIITSYPQCGYVYGRSLCHENGSCISIPFSIMCCPIAIV